MNGEKIARAKAGTFPLSFNLVFIRDLPFGPVTSMAGKEFANGK
jgi:hypothetical protein